MRRRFAGWIVWGLLLAALVAVAPGALTGSGSTVRCEERPGEVPGEEELAKELACPELVAAELLEPADALLARVLSGSDRGVDPNAFLAAATTEAEAFAPEGGDWQFVGPRNIGGRVLDIAVDPELANTIYVASASGGVWVSKDAGTNFTPAWPAAQTQAVGALAITPDGTLIAGTGEAGPGGGSLTYGGNGVYRSTDRGATWQHVGLPTSGRIGRIVVDPANPQRIFVAATGRLYKAGGERGVFLSEDGGSTWTKVLAGDNDTTGAVDLAIDPQDPRVVYAAMWDHLRQPSGRRYEGMGSGVYRSADGGKTWTRVGSPLLGPNPLLGRIGLAVGPDRTVYAIAAVNQGRHALFKSTDGSSFSPASADAALTQAASSFAWWFGRVWVDPKDPEHLFVAGLNLVESKNGGSSFANRSGVHADQHAMAWDPKVANRVYLGNDGGVYRSADNGTTWTFGKNMPWSQPYGLDVSEQDPTRIVTGLQDNGSNRSWGPNGTWASYHGGDGERTLIKPTNKNVIYGCAQYGNCVRSDNGGSSTSSLGERVAARQNWFTPIEFDPQDPNTIYTGGEILHRSTDQGDTFTPISGLLTRGVTSDTNPDYVNYGTLTTIAPAGKSTGTIYAGTDDGLLWYTHDDGTTWTQASDPDLPTAWVTRVEVSKTDPNRAFVTYSGMRSGDQAAYVLETRDGGASWTNITGNLPAAPLNDVNLIGDTVVVAGEVGVFFRRAGETDWRLLGAGMPLAPITELRYHAGTDTLFASNFGRGIWKIPAAVLKAP